MRRALAVSVVLLLTGACAASRPQPAAPPPAESGDANAGSESSAPAPSGSPSHKSLAELRRDFMASCTSKREGMPDLCECSWDQMQQVFTEADMNAATIDDAKLATFKERVRGACASKIPEDKIKQSFSAACTKRTPKMAAFCDCKWSEFRKVFSAAELTDEAAVTGQRFEDARRGTSKACGAKFVESTAHDDFAAACASKDDLKPFCECAWGVLRKSESAVNISLDLVKIDDHKPKIMSACGKLRPQG